MSNFLYHKKTSKFQLVIEPIDNLCKIEKSIINKRQKEILARKKIFETLFPECSLSYNDYGAPKLSNGKAISFSHSNELLAIITSDKHAAIDIEFIDDKAFKTRNKFLNEIELNFVKDLETATLLWCAKECLYKLYQKGNIIFKKHLKVNQLSNDIIKCSLFNKTYQLHFEKINKHWLVYYFD